jgi:hypothetical protein
MSEIIGNQINIRMARALGVLRVTHLYGNAYYDGENYVEDLNVMHRVIESLSMDDKIKWQKQLYKIIELGRYVPTHYDDVEFVQATAAQRAQAFLEIENE